MEEVAVRKTVRFWLNDDLVELDDFPHTQNVLDFLRLEQKLCGSKEGCAEGDCGACTVLIGRLIGDDLIYESVNSCIRFVASLDGCHVVSIEHLREKSGDLHPVQEAMVESHGSQCGFCTPGIVMSLYGLWMNEPGATRNEIEQALQGNLCRCTGYAPIIRAARSVLEAGGQENDPLLKGREKTRQNLIQMRDGRRVELSCDGGRIFIPADVDDLANILLEFPKATIIAGSTDVGLWVTKQMRDLPVLIFIAHMQELQKITEGENEITLGAGVSYSRAWPVILRNIPQLDELWSRIGGGQVRNMGTIGGNIANGSPIGDTPPPLIALGAKVVLRHGSSRRRVLLEDYFISYGQQDMKDGEFIESIDIPLPREGEVLASYKVSKRREEDISTLLGAFKIRVQDNRVDDIAIAFGGMAEIAKRARNVEKALLGREWNSETIEAAAKLFETDFTPLSDVRGSAKYRMTVARNLLKRFYLETMEQGGQSERGGV